MVGFAPLDPPLGPPPAECLDPPRHVFLYFALTADITDPILIATKNRLLCYFCVQIINLMADYGPELIANQCEPDG